MKKFMMNFLEERLGTGPLNAPKVEGKTGIVNDNPIHIEGDPKAEGGLFSRASPVSESSGSIPVQRIVVDRRLDPLWDNADVKKKNPNRDLKSGRNRRAVNRMDERKMLGIGAERQYQVNKFLSYNPKKNWSDRFQELSPVEKILLIVLIVAVIIVTGL